MWKCLSTALGRPDYIRNNPGRLTGRALFRSHLLARQGQLTDIPYKLTSDIITYSRGHWQAGQQDRRYRSHCFTAWGVKQLVHSLRASDLGKMLPNKAMLLDSQPYGGLLRTAQEEYSLWDTS
ncbi:hypothetical protein WJX79_002212 [Trebouxia sp. C0005]